jgi:hypothetical protein
VTQVPRQLMSATRADAVIAPVSNTLASSSEHRADRKAPSVVVPRVRHSASSSASSLLPCRARGTEIAASDSPEVVVDDVVRNDVDCGEQPPDTAIQPRDRRRALRVGGHGQGACQPPAHQTRVQAVVQAVEAGVMTPGERGTHLGANNGSSSTGGERWTAKVGSDAAPLPPLRPMLGSTRATILITCCRTVGLGRRDRAACSDRYRGGPQSGCH